MRVFKVQRARNIDDITKCDLKSSRFWAAALIWWGLTVCSISVIIGRAAGILWVTGELMRVVVFCLETLSWTHSFWEGAAWRSTSTGEYTSIQKVFISLTKVALEKKKKEIEEREIKKEQKYKKKIRKYIVTWYPTETIEIKFLLSSCLNQQWQAVKEWPLRPDVCT